MKERKNLLICVLNVENMVSYFYNKSMCVNTSFVILNNTSKLKGGWFPIPISHTSELVSMYVTLSY